MKIKQATKFMPLIGFLIQQLFELLTFSNGSKWDFIFNIEEKVTQYLDLFAPFITLTYKMYTEKVCTHVSDI